jgi:hypothetical protein
MPTKAGDAGLEFLVQILRAADKPHRTQAVAVGAQRLVRRLEHLGVRGQAEIVVGAQVDDLAPIGKPHHGALGPGDDPLRLIYAGRADLLHLVA